MPQGVERLVEVPPGALLLHLTPQQRAQPVAVDPPIARAGEHRQDGEAPRLLRVATQRQRTVEHRKPAERLDALQEQPLAALGIRPISRARPTVTRGTERRGSNPS